MNWLLCRIKSKMASFFGGGFDGSCVPLMSQGDEESEEESKEADPSLVDMENVMETTNHNGDVGHDGKTQAIGQSQRNVSSTTWDWDAEFLDCVLAHVLNKDRINADLMWVIGHLCVFLLWPP